MPKGEFSTNLHNDNDFTDTEWEMVKTMHRRRVWGVRVVRIADKAGRTVYKSRVARWIYDHDLWTLAVPCAVVLVFLAVAMTAVGIVVL